MLANNRNSIRVMIVYTRASGITIVPHCIKGKKHELSQEITCFHYSPSPHPPPPTPNPHIACWQNGSHFLSSETQPCWQVGTMGHRMKNYGLAAGPRSTMHLSVSEECKTPAYTAQRRKNHSASGSSQASVVNAPPVFHQGSRLISSLCL